MNILLFGGSFDPVHKGHIDLIKHVSNLLNIEQVILIPAKNAHFGKQIIANDFDRLAMLEIAIKPYDNWKIDSFEINQDTDQPSYSYITIEHFMKLYPQDKIYFLIGADQLLNFHIWKKPEWISAHVNLVVVNRHNVDLAALSKQYKALVINDFISDISSTNVRDDLNPLNLPSLEIYHYIINHGLYHQCWLAKVMNHKKRYLHVVRVASLMRQVLKTHAPTLIQQGWIAGLYHDLAKNYDDITLLSIFEKTKYPMNHIKTLHGPVGAYVLKHTYGVHDELVLNAISRHTVVYGFINTSLSLLDEVLYCCDKLESARTNHEINNIEHFRDLLKTNVRQCFKELYVQLSETKKHGGC